MIMQWVDLFWRFTACSFLGWVLETAVFSIRQRRFVNRGFLAGPICPVYGFGAILLLSILGRFEQAWPLVLLFGIILTTLLEYVSSWALELIFHARWWDYSNQPLNLQGRITLFHSLLWGCLGLLLVYGLNPVLTVILAQVSPPVRLWAAIAVAILLLSDLTVTVLGLIDLNRQLARLQEKMLQIRQKNKELGQNVRIRLAVLAQSFRDMRRQARTIGPVQRRILLAFPNFRSLRHQEALRRLRRWLKEHRPQQVWPMADIRLLRDQLPALSKLRKHDRHK